MMAIDWSNFFDIENKHHNEKYSREAVGDELNEDPESDPVDDEPEDNDTSDSEGSIEEDDMDEGDSSSDEDDESDNEPPPQAPEGEFPTRQLNAKQKLNEELTLFITKVGENLRLYEENEKELDDSDKKIENDLRNLHKNIKLVKEAVFSTDHTETMLRYKLLIRRYQNIVDGK